MGKGPPFPITGGTAILASASAHRLFQVCFSNSSLVVFCRRCGVYTAKRVNSGMAGQCSGSPSQSGKVALSRIDRGLHPSREPIYKHSLVLGRPSPFVAVEEGPSNSGFSSAQSSTVRPISAVQPLLDRVRRRAQGASVDT